jgi:hypothetical protein
LKTQIIGHFILYEAIQISTGRNIGEFVIAQDEPDQDKALKRELKNLAKENNIRIADLEYRAEGKH